MEKVNNFRKSKYRRYPIEETGPNLPSIYKSFISTFSVVDICIKVNLYDEFISIGLFTLGLSNSNGEFPFRFIVFYLLQPIPIPFCCSIISWTSNSCEYTITSFSLSLERILESKFVSYKFIASNHFLDGTDSTIQLTLKKNSLEKHSLVWPWSPKYQVIAKNSIFLYQNEA